MLGIIIGDMYESSCFGESTIDDKNNIIFNESNHFSAISILTALANNTIERITIPMVASRSKFEYYTLLE